MLLKNRERTGIQTDLSLIFRDTVLSVLLAQISVLDKNSPVVTLVGCPWTWLPRPEHLTRERSHSSTNVRLYFGLVILLCDLTEMYFRDEPRDCVWRPSPLKASSPASASVAYEKQSLELLWPRGSGPMPSPFIWTHGDAHLWCILPPQPEGLTASLSRYTDPDV